MNDQEQTADESSQGVPKAVVARRINHTLNALVVVAVVLVAFVRFPSLDTPWATFTDFTAGYNPVTKTVDIDFWLNKTMQCRRVVVYKILSPLEGNDVLGKVISLNGHLPAKLLEAPIGGSAVEDSASAREPLVPGRQYRLTMIAFCEPEPDQALHASANLAPAAELLDTEPVRFLITVPK